MEIGVGVPVHLAGRLASYRIDQNSGELTPLETYEGGQRPMWVLLADLSA